MANKVIAAVRNRDPPGRFLEPLGDGKDAHKEGYADARDRKVFEKTCQALREKKWKNMTKESLETLLTISGCQPGSVPIPTKASGEDDSYADSGSYKSGTASYLSSHQEQFDNNKNHEDHQKQLDSVGAGSSISVYWPLDRTYYGAQVKQRENDRVLVQYNEDGVQEWISLKEHQVKVH